VFGYKKGLDINGTVAELSGHAVSLSDDGSVVAIGSPLIYGGGFSKKGLVRVFKYKNGGWVQEGATIEGKVDNEQAGYSLSLSADGSVISIGSPYHAGGGNVRGQVRVYKNINGSWVQEGNDINGVSDGDREGFSVSLSNNGSVLAIGAPAHSMGHVRVYKFLSGSWIKQGADIDGEAASYYFGYSVSLSDDGSVVAIGAPGHSSGRVQVFRYLSGSWIKQLLDIDEEAYDDKAGWAVSLISDGSTVAIGAPYNDAGIINSNRGHVRVYSSCSQVNRFLNSFLSAFKYGSKKVYICHRGVSTLQVTYQELLMHIAHGDILGQCGKANCDGIQLRGSNMDDYIVKGESESLKQEMELYPNPAQNMLNIKLPNSLDKPVQIQVINSLGRVLLDELSAIAKIDKPGIALNIQSIPAGYYIISASFDGYMLTKQFIKL